MKWWKLFLLAIGVLIVGIFGVLFVLGLRSDANRLQASVVISAPASRVWPYLYEPDKLKSWVGWLVEVRRNANTPPAPGTEAVWVMEDRNNNNALMEIKGKAVEVDPERKLVLDLSSEPMFRGTTLYTLTDLGNGQTRLESDSRYVIDNSFARLMMPLVIQQARKKLVADLDRLRSKVEASR
jgi:uncharacterized protein YndB with AHSA1/START domain